MLELALLAIEPSDAGTPPGEDDLIHELLEAIDLTQPTATRNALALALTLSATPGVQARHRSGIGVPRRSVGESDRIRSGIETANPIQKASTS
jgi:hypothetical protein